MDKETKDRLEAAEFRFGDAENEISTRNVNNPVASDLVKCAIYDLLDMCILEHKLKHGSTALYWHILNIIESHIKSPKQERNFNTDDKI